MPADLGLIRRYPEAQDAGQPSAYVRALAELRAGRKRSHWIWFVLPQLSGLGVSAMAQRYGIAGLAEAHTWRTRCSSSGWML